MDGSSEPALVSSARSSGATTFENIRVGDRPLLVLPKAGRALFWPNTLENAPFTTDERTRHAAEPVISSEDIAGPAAVKIAANFWLHQYDYQSADAAGCADDVVNYEP